MRKLDLGLLILDLLREIAVYEGIKLSSKKWLMVG